MGAIDLFFRRKTKKNPHRNKIKIQTFLLLSATENDSRRTPTLFNKHHSSAIFAPSVSWPFHESEKNKKKKAVSASLLSKGGIFNRSGAQASRNSVGFGLPRPDVLNPPRELSALPPAADTLPELSSFASPHVPNSKLPSVPPPNPNPSFSRSPLPNPPSASRSPPVYRGRQEATKSVAKVAEKTGRAQKQPREIRRR